MCSRISQRVALTLVVLAFLVTLARASAGDRSKDFRDCLPICEKHECALDAKGNPPQLSGALFLTGWTCADDCKYRCMHVVTDAAEYMGRPVQQFYGKWPFVRMYGMQEPASVLFSLLNLWGHVRGAKLVRRRMPDDHPMKKFYLWWAGISVNSWFWSAVFHTRDKPWTERLDYFSAVSGIVFALYYTVIRLFFVFPFPGTDSSPTTTLYATSNSHFFRPWTVLCSLVFTAHVTYLSLLPRFDYSYNIVFNIVIGLAHNVLWVLYALPASIIPFRRFPSTAVPPTHRPKFVVKAVFVVALTTAATALELLDFPPWRRILDAHALWHLATAPLVVFWYDFLVEDALDEGWKLAKG